MRTTLQLGPRSARRGGFTLMEALVAVAGVAILALGIAAVFSAVSKTVKTGRRVSAINNYAAVIERLLREDVSRMTRDGFLVIRNEYPLNTGGVPLSPESLKSKRVRRIDELLFFARGRYESARTPLDPAFTAKSGVAQVYFGHGQKQLEGGFGFSTPFLDDPNDDPLLRHGLSDVEDGIGEINPNYFAGDWTLLRRVALLKTPQPHPVGAPGPFGVPAGVANLPQRAYEDNELQISGQPATADVFRALQTIGRPVDDPSLDPGGDSGFAPYSIRQEEVSPLFASGLVDIATTSLSEVKQRVTTVYGVQSTALPNAPISFYFPTPESVIEAVDTLPRGGGVDPVYYVMSGRTLGEYRQTRFDPVTETFDALAPLGTLGGMQTLVHLQHAWMSDALPAPSHEREWESTDSDWTLDPGLRFSWRGTSFRSIQGVGTSRTRMRYENTPPGYNADVFGPWAAGQGGGGINQIRGAVLQAAYRADQQMVTASQFIPRCTEFAVEWSFGERVPEGASDPDAGEVIWYGHDADGRLDDRAAEARWLRPDEDRPIPNARSNGVPQPLQPDEQRLLERHLLADLVNGTVTDNGSTGGRRIKGSPVRFPLTHYFGYGDPRAVRVFDFIDGSGNEIENDGYDVNDDGIRDDIDGNGVYDDAWPWPTIIRITMSFADPIDQTVEETFQFVIEVPDGRGI